MNKVVIGMALALTLGFSAVGSAAPNGSVGNGNIEVHKGGQLSEKLSGQNIVEDGALLVCDGKCMIKSEGISLVAADQSKLAIHNEEKAFNLFLRSGRVNYTITNNARKIAFHTPQGTYTTAEVIFNAGSNPVVRGYVQVNKDGQTEIGVEEGRMTFATAEGMKTVDAHHKIILAISQVPESAPPVAESAAIVSAETLWGIGAAAVLVGGVVIVADNDGGSSSNEATTTPTGTPNTPNPTPAASPNS